MSKPMPRMGAVRATLRLSPVRRERRRRPLLLLSLAVHAAVLALFLIRFAQQQQDDRKPEPAPTQPADYAVVFKSQQGPESVPEKVAPGPARAPASTPLTAPPPPPPPPPAPAQPPAPVTPPAPETQPAEEQPSPTAPQVKPAPPAPQVKPAPPTPEGPSPEPVRPPPIPPSPPRQAARPAPRPAQRPAQPSRPSPDFPAPMDFSFGPKPLLRPPERPGSSTQQVYGPRPSYNAPVDPEKSGPSFLYDYKQISGPRLGADWFERLLAYWLAHRRYPEQAIANLESGTALIRIRVDPYGHVKETELEGRSGSIWLDAAAQSWIRGAQLQPFPPGTLGEDAVIDVRIRYELIFHR